MPTGIYKQLNLLVSEEAVFSGISMFEGLCMSSFLSSLEKLLCKPPRLRCFCIFSPRNGTMGHKIRKNKTQVLPTKNQSSKVQGRGCRQLGCV